MGKQLLRVITIVVAVLAVVIGLGAQGSKKKRN